MIALLITLQSVTPNYVKLTYINDKSYTSKTNNKIYGLTILYDRTLLRISEQSCLGSTLGQGWPSFKLLWILGLHAAMRHVAISEAASRS